MLLYITGRMFRPVGGLSKSKQASQNEFKMGASAASKALGFS